jgi:hypothetical protein
MFFIYNPRLVSQAGRRGFEPRLPLHLFSNLKRIEHQALLRFLSEIGGNGRFLGCPPSPESRASLLNHLRFEALRCVDLLLYTAD